LYLKKPTSQGFMIMKNFINVEIGIALIGDDEEPVVDKK
jgi:hypothetical protein